MLSVTASLIDSQKVTPDLAADRMSAFCAAQGRGLPWGDKLSFEWNDIKSVDAPIPTCACCGIRTPHIDNSDWKNGKSTNRTYKEVLVDEILIDKLRLREGDEDVEIEGDPGIESNDVEEIEIGEDSEDIDNEESNDDSKSDDTQDKCKLTGPRSGRTQG